MIVLGLFGNSSQLCSAYTFEEVNPSKGVSLPICLMGWSSKSCPFVEAAPARLLNHATIHSSVIGKGWVEVSGQRQSCFSSNVHSQDLSATPK